VKYLFVVLAILISGLLLSSKSEGNTPDSNDDDYFLDEKDDGFGDGGD
jgi:hypothetical protein